MQLERRSSKLVGGSAIAGLLVGYVGGALMHFPPFPIQRLLRNPIADAIVAVIAFGTIASLALWARQSRHAEREALVVTTISVGVLAIIVNVVAPKEGWWGGPVFEAPLLPLALLTGLRAMFLLGLLLLFYRWIAARRVWLARLTYGLILLALIPATIFGDQMVLASGVLAFGRGYTVGKDVLVGEFLFAFPPIVYEMLRRYAGGVAA